MKGDRRRSGIEHDEDRRLAALDRPEHIGEKAAFGKIPVRLLHFFRRWGEPQYAIGTVGAPPVEPAVRANLRKAPAYRGHAADEIDEVVLLAADTAPIDPADLIVLAVGVVVAGLRVADFIARKQQRHALRQKQAGELVLAQSMA